MGIEREDAHRTAGVVGCEQQPAIGSDVAGIGAVAGQGVAQRHLSRSLVEVDVVHGCCRVAVLRYGIYLVAGPIEREEGRVGQPQRVERCGFASELVEREGIHPFAVVVGIGTHDHVECGLRLGSQAREEAERGEQTPPVVDSLCGHRI